MRNLLFEDFLQHIPCVTVRCKMHFNNYRLRKVAACPHCFALPVRAECGRLIFMNDRILTQEKLEAFLDYLCREEKSAATQEKYLRDARGFCTYANGAVITKELVLAWKKYLIGVGYAARSINSMLASVNSLLDFLNWKDCRVKNIRFQRQIYCTEERELTKAEYLRLLDVSRKSEQLNLILQAICGTGIRVSELQYFTVEAVRNGEVTVNCKGKTRTIIVPGKLRKLLLNFARKRGIHTGPVFVNKKGIPLNRSSIWRSMKQISRAAGVQQSKVFPHNLRKLFARTFYSFEKDIAKLADILGHSSIDTTRIYIVTTGAEHRNKIERLGLVI